MFGYHHSDRCMLNLWAPTLSPSYAEDVAFSVYAKHTQEMEDIITTIIEAKLRGETNITIDIDDDFSEADLEFIKQEVFRRCGMTMG